jgi:hypothetical protein
MEGELDTLVMQPRPTRARPLLGLTVLVVEDSRYSSEALRQMCLRSGRASAGPTVSPRPSGT